MVKIILNKWAKHLKSLDEVQRRRAAAIKALEMGRGGISKINKITKISRDTIRKGIREVKFGKLNKPPRLRKNCGGRKKLKDKYPKLKRDLDILMKDNTAGDPMNRLKWTNKSTYSIANFLKSKGHDISEVTVGRILKEEEYSLQ